MGDSFRSTPRRTDVRTIDAGARAELLAKTGAQEEAFRAYEIAIGLERDAAVRRFLQKRQAELTQTGIALN